MSLSGKHMKWDHHAKKNKSDSVYIEFFTHIWKLDWGHTYTV